MVVSGWCREVTPVDEALGGAHGSRKLCQRCLGADGHGHCAWVGADGHSRGVGRLWLCLISTVASSSGCVRDLRGGN